MIKYIIYILLVAPLLLKGQDIKIAYGTVVGGDTIPFVQLKKVYVIAKRLFNSSKERWKYEKLKRDVMKVYPYAVIAAQTLQNINDGVAQIEKKRLRKKYIKTRERELKENFKDPLKNLTITQGKILVKLIQRETGTNCYYLIKELKSGFSASYWQFIGGFLGYDLKIEYDPKIDEDIESILIAIEAS